MPLQIDRLLETAVRQNASETWLVVGRPPVFRIENALTPAQIDPLTTEEIEAVLPEDEARRYRQTGLADFTLNYGGNYAAFWVTAFRVGKDALILLRTVKKPDVAARRS
jgi:Tfp pilus assembly pilus retraction ATPase PilT